MAGAILVARNVMKFLSIAVKVMTKVMKMMKMTTTTTMGRVRERRESEPSSKRTFYLCPRRSLNQRQALCSIVVASQRRRNEDDQGKHLCLYLQSLFSPYLWPLHLPLQFQNLGSNLNNTFLPFSYYFLSLTHQSHLQIRTLLISRVTGTSFHHPRFHLFMHRKLSPSSTLQS